MADDSGGHSADVLSTLTSIASRITKRLREDGVAVVSGFPVDGLTERRAAAIFITLGSYLGTLREQNRQGNLVHTVTDRTVLGVSQELAGGSNSRKEIALHTENARPPHPPHTLALLCLVKARTGGESVLLDGAFVYSELRRDHSLLTAACEPKTFGRHEEDRDDGKETDDSPIFWYDDRQLRFRYSRYWLDVAHRQSGAARSAGDQVLFDRIDDILKIDHAKVRLMLQPGDALFVDNRRTMHGRAEFDDESDPTLRRKLLRIWIDTP